MTFYLILMIKLAVGLTLACAAFRVRSFRIDAFLLSIAAIFVIGHTLLWELFPFGLSGVMPAPLRPLTTSVTLLLGPPLIYLAGLVSVGRFFLTPIRGWPRAMYMVGGILLLLPVILLLLISLSFYAFSPR